MNSSGAGPSENQMTALLKETQKNASLTARQFFAGLFYAAQIDNNVNPDKIALLSVQYADILLKALG